MKMRHCVELVRGLEELVLFVQPRVVIEIGSWTGESAKIFLQYPQLTKIYCVDPWAPEYLDSNLKSVDISAIEKQFDLTIGGDKRVVKVKCASPMASNLFNDECADLIYVDGSHEEPAVVQDLEAFIPKVAKDGYIGGHDYGPKKFRGGMHFPGVKKVVDKVVGLPDKVFEDSSWIKRL